MPLLVAIDEYDSALHAIAAHAEVGLRDSSHQKAALQIILGLCHKTNETVTDTMTYATTQIAGIMHTKGA